LLLSAAARGWALLPTLQLHVANKAHATNIGSMMSPKAENQAAVCAAHAPAGYSQKHAR
jgi:hypothetical protein